MQRSAYLSQMTELENKVLVREIGKLAGPLVVLAPDWLRDDYLLWRARTSYLLWRFWQFQQQLFKRHGLCAGERGHKPLVKSRMMR